MYRYSRILIVIALLAIVFSVFTFSASAESVDNSSTVITSVEEDITIDNSSDLELTNVYLKYITGILIFFLIAFLLWAVYKFFNLFF